MAQARWEYWKNPKTKKWDSQSVRKGRVLHISRQGYNRVGDCLNAIGASGGSGALLDVKQVEFKDRTISPRKPRAIKK